MARKCWPGPLTLIMAGGVDRGLAGRLPESVRQRVCPAGTVGLRLPAHASIRETLRRLPGPVVLTSANRSGEPAATTAEEVQQAVGQDLDVLIDDGPTYYRQASTVVGINGNAWSILREGVVTAGGHRRSGPFSTDRSTAEKSSGTCWRNTRLAARRAQLPRPDSPEQRWRRADATARARHAHAPPPARGRDRGV